MIQQAVPDPVASAPAVSPPPWVLWGAPLLLSVGSFNLNLGSSDTSAILVGFLNPFKSSCICDASGTPRWCLARWWRRHGRLIGSGRLSFVIVAPSMRGSVHVWLPFLVVLLYFDLLRDNLLFGCSPNIICVYKKKLSDIRYSLRP